MTPTRFALAASLALVPSLGAAQAPVLTKDFTLGCADCGGALQFSNFHTVELSPKGEILVADRDNPMLRLFDGTGKPVWSGGTKGRGPGEYQYILRVAFRPDGGLDVIDLSGFRHTTLGADRKVIASSTLQSLPTTAATNDRGAMVIGSESPGGGFKVFRVRAGGMDPVVLPSLPKPENEKPFKGSSVALAPNGSIAFVPNNTLYQVVVIDPSGKRLADITRNIERPLRTAQEEQALKARIKGEMGQMMAALEKSTGKAPSGTPIATEPVQLSLKPHFAVDGLRYDGAGRLWARTMRGDDAHTVFDVFSPSGAFLGSVTVDGTVQHFALAGKWLLTSGENADGVPTVTRWSVR
jgi:hypothetical protein